MSEVLKGVPMPDPPKESIISSKLKKLTEIGDAIDIEVGDNPSGRRASIYMTATRLGINVTTQKNGTMFRVWRKQ